jgi:cellulose synthase/poly-beta-1,6-N-acetylglucosamine synthase-like glycosyltransferase
MYEALNVAAFLLMIKVLYNVLRVLVVKLWRAYQSIEIRPTKYSALPRVLILIPILNEQKIARQVVDTAIQLDTSYFGNTEIILMCSKRERATHDISDTSYSILTKMLSSLSPNSGIRIWETDGTDKCKSDQLNQALGVSFLYNDDKSSNDLLIGVYDADSVPDKSTLNEVVTRYKNSNGTVKAFQQPPLYSVRMTDNLNTAGNLFNNLILISRAIYSLAFSYKESFGYLLSGTILDARLSHFTGHGYFVERDTLDRVGGFTPPSCDTTLGYRLSLLKCKIQLLCSHDHSSMPTSLKDLLSQGVVWYNGCNMYFTEYTRLRSEFKLKVSTIYASIKILGVFMTNLAWSIMPVLWMFLLFIALFISPAIDVWYMGFGGWLLFNAYMFYEYYTYIGSRKENGLYLLYAFTFPLIYPLSRVIGCIPPLYYYLLRTLKMEIVLRKTKR